MPTIRGNGALTTDNDYKVAKVMMSIDIQECRNLVWNKIGDLKQDWEFRDPNIFCRWRVFDLRKRNSQLQVRKPLE